MNRSPKPATDEMTHGPRQENLSCRGNGLSKSMLFMTNALHHERVSYPRNEPSGGEGVDSVGRRKIYWAQIPAEMSAAMIAKLKPAICAAPQHTRMINPSCGAKLATGWSQILVKSAPSSRAIMNAAGKRKRAPRQAAARIISNPP